MLGINALTLCKPQSASAGMTGRGQDKSPVTEVVLSNVFGLLPTTVTESCNEIKPNIPTTRLLFSGKDLQPFSPELQEP